MGMKVEMERGYQLDFIESSKGTSKDLARLGSYDLTTVSQGEKSD